MATIDNTNWNYEKPIEGDSQATAPNGAKVQPVILDGSISEGSTGNGNIGYDTSRIDTTDVNTKLQSIVFTEPDGSTTKPYEVENPDDLGTANEVVVWIYDSGWATDDTVAFNFYTGAGDGTDYSYSTDSNVTGDTGANPWGETGVNAEVVLHQNDLDGDDATNDTVQDSSPNGNDGTAIGSISAEGQFDGGSSSDGVDDYIELPDLSLSNITLVQAFNIDNFSGIQVFTGGFDSTTEFELQADGDWTWGAFDGSSSYGLINVGSNSANTDYLVHASFNNSNNEWILDANNSNIGSTTTSQDLSDSDNSANYAIAGQPNSSNFMDMVCSELRIYSDVKDSNWKEADYDASPKGGQIFFNANQGSTTDQPGSVVQTNSSGVIQTTADGVVKTEP